MQLQRHNRPRVSIEAALADLESISGFEHEKTRIGDTIFVVARRGELTVQLEASIYRIDRDRNSPEKTRYYLGEPAPMGTQTIQALNEMRIKQDKGRRYLDRGRGPATLTLASADTSRMPWYDDIIVPYGGMADPYINEALERIREAGGGKLYIKEGWYPIEQPIILQGGETIEGQGSQTYLELYGCGTPGTAVFTAAAATGNITIRHMKLGGMSAVNENGLAVDIAGAEKVELSNLDIFSFSDGGIRVTNCGELYLGRLRIGFRESWHSDVMGGGAGVLIEQCASVLVESSQIMLCEYNGLGISRCGQVKIVGGNYFELNNQEGGSAALWLDQIEALTINGNAFNNSYRAGIYFAVCDGAIITGNTFYNSGTLGGVRIALSDNVNISANIFSEGVAGIFIEDGEKNVVVGNKICNHTYGIINSFQAVKTKVGVNDLLDNVYDLQDHGTNTDTSGMNRMGA